MATKTKTLKYKVWICDDCGTEYSYEDELIKCSSCNKSVCRGCQGYYEFDLLKFKGCSGIHEKLAYKNRRIKDCFCFTCGEALEKKLATVGFTILDFKGILI